MNFQDLIALMCESVQQLRSGLSHLTDEDVLGLAHELKSNVDTHWYKDPTQSILFADALMTLGCLKDNVWIIALGMMARGDTLRIMGEISKAWEVLEYAGQLFHSVKDEVGWARTRIGLLPMCSDLNRVEQTMRDAEIAEAIFRQHQDQERLVRLFINKAVALDFLGDFARALALYQQGISIAEELGEQGQTYLGTLYINSGYALNYLGDLEQALTYYQKAFEQFSSQQQVGAAAFAQVNIAHIAVARGQYRRALYLLHKANQLMSKHFTLDAATLQRDIVECYLSLNRHIEALELAQHIIEICTEKKADRERAWALLLLARTRVEMMRFAHQHEMQLHSEVAIQAFDDAREIFIQLNAQSWLAIVNLHKGRLFYEQQRFAEAQKLASTSLTIFEDTGQHSHYPIAALLYAQAASEMGDDATATRYALSALELARRHHLPIVEYEIQVLLGGLREKQRRAGRAALHYQRATNIIEQLQRNLTIVLRGDFLHDKGKALRHLIRLQLQANRLSAAFESLERYKTQLHLSYLINKEHLRWLPDDPEVLPLIQQLNHLRAEHHWFYRITTSAQTETNKARAFAEMVQREKAMQAITQQLYLYLGENQKPNEVQVPTLEEIQGEIDADSLLVEFYDDGLSLFAFTLGLDGLRGYPLSASIGEVTALLESLKENISWALDYPATHESNKWRTEQCQRISRRLYSMLLAPIECELAHCQRLIIVPYGNLHLLSFALLYNGVHYLAQQFELVTLPSAGLLTRQTLVPRSGTLILAHSSDGRLPSATLEGATVHKYLGGDLFMDRAAVRQLLFQPPRQVLHIAAHGDYLMENPDFSYLLLEDGALYADDLFQHDLSYELITLSACQTNTARVVSEDLIGLGRGFLTAGAQALIASQWRVEDTVTATLMDHLYRGLRDRMSKAAALKEAQCNLLADHLNLHPAFWAAFQLSGNPASLSSSESRLE